MNPAVPAPTAAPPPPVLTPLDRAASLPPLEHAHRLRALQAALTTAGPAEPDGAPSAVDALVVTKLINVRYLCGFTGSNGVLVVHPHGATLLTDGRYRDQAAAQLDAGGVDAGLRVETIDLDGALAELLAEHRTVGLEAAAVTWAAQRRYAERSPAVRFVPTLNQVERLRVRKDAGELARMEIAADIADRALHETIALLHEGPTEARFALALDDAMRRLGAEGPSFETIVAGGPNGALPHARPGHRHIERGDLVVLDFGATFDGYRSDTTRTVCVGRADDRQRHLFEVVRDAQAAGRDAVRAGVPTKHIDAVCRAVIGDAGWAEQFSHGTGHGVGLEIHETPFLSRTTPGELEAGSVVTVEPGVYLPGLGGVRVEDTVVVDDAGCRSLTRFPKTLELFA
ncbi:MAG: aminopeptidase P family protein [Acidimicrobiales bacterium]